MSRLKILAGNLALFFSVMLLLLAAVEWLFPRVFPYLLPLEAAYSFEEPYGLAPVLATSKRGFLPRDYIALVGDSYAMGMGDDTLQLIAQRRARFGSAPVLHELTGRDVISYGQPGAGSLRGLISHPLSGQLYLRYQFGEGLRDPDWIVLYFYEGNDLIENWMYYQKTFPGYAPDGHYGDPETFERYVRDIVLGRQHLYLAATRPRWFDQWLFPRYVWRVLAEKWAGHQLPRYSYPEEFGLVYVPPERWIPRLVKHPVNHADMAGKRVPLPDNLQGPALELDDAQIAHALDTFTRALSYARKSFPESRFAVVYVPSVLATYSLASESVHAQNYFGGTNLHPASLVASRHQQIRDAVAGVCADQSLLFADTTPDLRAAAAQTAIHGPKDWNHLTQAGYEVLGQSVARQLPVLNAGKP